MIENYSPNEQVYLRICQRAQTCNIDERPALINQRREQNIIIRTTFYKINQLQFQGSRY